ncbi:MAG: MOSC domain-containing protein [Lachnospiraceae bacterium]|nr:MOSC domain-containing protein [Lachnospiraceae bacterium]
MGKIMAVCASEKKGTVKREIESGRLIEDFGLENDAHAGSERQVSLLSFERVEEFKKRTGKEIVIEPGAFGENLLVSGIDLVGLPVGTKLKVGDDILLEISQIGKVCHSGCEIARRTGECIMPKEGVFARVISGGTIRTGDLIHTESAMTSAGKVRFTAAVITSSDRAYNGEREDSSGPLIKEITERSGYTVVESCLLPDEEEEIYEELVRLSDNVKPDVIFTTGGTGFSERDRMPEATMRVADRNAPGIAEAIRAYSMQITPRAMLSRAVSVIRGRTLIVNLPGSPKAVRECLDFLLPGLEHGLLILRGEADG